jgi:mRNA interferase MazF
VSWEYGEIVTALGGTYATKPRPVLILQNPLFETGDSIIVAPLTSVRNDQNQTRVAITPNKLNGLDRDCFVEVDKISAIKTSALGTSIGHLDEVELREVTALAVSLITPSVAK